MKSVRKTPLAKALAADALTAVYRKGTRLSMEELQACIAGETRPRLLASYLRSQREAQGRIIARAFLKTLGKLETDFLRGHYRDGKGIHALAYHLPIEERQLYVLHEGLLSRLASLLSYRLAAEDIYFPSLLLTMLSVLDMRIATFTLRADLPIAQGFLDTLYESRTKCRAMLSLVERFAKGEAETGFSRTIAAKLAQPHKQASELTAMTSGAWSLAQENRIREHLKSYRAMALEILGDDGERT